MSYNIRLCLIVSCHTMLLIHVLSIYVFPEQWWAVWESLGGLTSQIQPLMLIAKRGGNGYYFYSLWHDLTRDRTHNQVTTLQKKKSHCTCGRVSQGGHCNTGRLNCLLLTFVHILSDDLVVFLVVYLPDTGNKNGQQKLDFCCPSSGL